MDVKIIIEHQYQLINKWETRKKELEQVISKHPWYKISEDDNSGDWRVSELARRNEQIEESKKIVRILKGEM